MRKRRYRMILIILLFAGIAGFSVYEYFHIRAQVPNEIRLLISKEETYSFELPVTAEIQPENDEEDVIGVLHVNEEPLGKEKILVNLAKPVTIFSGQTGTYWMDVRLFGFLPLKNVKLQVVEELKLIPGGNMIGIQVKTDGIMVLGNAQIQCTDGYNYTPSAGKLEAGDYILSVNGTIVKTKEDFIEKIGKSPMKLTVRRLDTLRQVEIQPVQALDGTYKIGTWIRTDTQGIGTLTFATNNGYFGALGHGIADVDTGLLMRVSEGEAYDAEVLSIIMGTEGSPGEVAGIIKQSEENRFGHILFNTNKGVFGKVNSENPKNEMGDKTVPIALKQEVKTGAATIRCEIDNVVREYRIEILHIDMAAENENKGLMIQITDEGLLKKTGGIVQGMSGSPIFQNGKLIGAVTHVFIKDPQKGYGIFIENMINELGSIWK